MSIQDDPRRFLPWRLQHLAGRPRQLDRCHRGPPHDLRRVLVSVQHQPRPVHLEAQHIGDEVCLLLISQFQLKYDIEELHRIM